MRVAQMVCLSALYGAYGLAGVITFVGVGI